MFLKYLQYKSFISDPAYFAYDADTYYDVEIPHIVRLKRQITAGGLSSSSQSTDNATVAAAAAATAPAAAVASSSVNRSTSVPLTGGDESSVKNEKSSSTSIEDKSSITSKGSKKFQPTTMTKLLGENGTGILLNPPAQPPKTVLTSSLSATAAGSTEPAVPPPPATSKTDYEVDEVIENIDLSSNETEAVLANNHNFTSVNKDVRFFTLINVLFIFNLKTFFFFSQFLFYNSTTFVDPIKTADEWKRVKEMEINTLLSQSHRRAIVSEDERKCKCFDLNNFWFFSRPLN